MIKDSAFRRSNFKSQEEMTNNPKINEFGKFRQTSTNRREDVLKHKIGQNERAVLPPSVGMQTGANIVYGGTFDNLDPIERKKKIADRIVEENFLKNKQRLITYRSIARTAEVAEILENISNEAIIDNNDGQIISLNIRDNFPNIAIGEVTRIKLQQDFNQLMQNVFNFDENASKYFYKYLVEGSMFWEVVYNEEKNKIVGVNQLPSYNMIVIVDKGEIVGYRQILDQEYGGISMDTTKLMQNGQYSYIDYHVNQILWWDYGMWGNGINDRYSYLEPAKKLVNTLNNMEDSYAKYVIMRGHEKRVYYIATGKMPPAKAEEHVQRQSQTLNRRMFYNADDGSVVGNERIQAMSEDFYIPLPDGNQPSRIETLQAGMNIGEVTPLNYFREKIYQALKYPRSRSRLNQPNSPSYSTGKPGEIDREEITLTRFIESMQKKLGTMLIELFVMFLETRTEYDASLKDPKLYSIVFEQSNLFKLYKESEITSLRLDILSKAQPFITDHTDGPNDIFSLEVVLKDLCRFSDEQYLKNKQCKDKELIQYLRQKERRDELNKETQNLQAPEGSSDLGGGGMGGSLGDLGGEMPPGDLGGSGMDAGQPPPGDTPELTIPGETNPSETPNNAEQK